MMPSRAGKERARSELAFVNNLLIGLTAGLMVVALTDATDVARIGHLLAWQRLAAGIGVIVLGAALLAGVLLAVNRLQSARLTARLVRIRGLRDRVFSGDGRQRLALHKNLQGLDHWEHWTRPEIRKAARACVHQDVKLTEDAVNAAVGELRAWTAERADPRSWQLVRAQAWLFVIGAGLLASVPISNYLR